jgi:hypothetical protein
MDQSNKLNFFVFMNSLTKENSGENHPLFFLFYDVRRFSFTFTSKPRLIQ